MPRDVRVAFQCNEIRLTLKTCDRSTAKQRALRFSLVTADYLTRIRRASSVEEATSIGREMIESLGQVSFDGVADFFRDMLPEVNGEQQALLRKLVALRERHSQIEAEKLAMLRQVVEQLPGKEDSEIDSLFCDLYADLTPLVSESASLKDELQDVASSAQRLVQGAFHARDLAELQEAQQADLERLTDFAAQIAAKTTVKAAEALAQGEGADRKAEMPSEQLSAVVAAYCDNQNAEGSWTTKTNAENRAIFALWLRIVGDQPISGYGYEQHRAYKAKLQRLPPNINKSARYRELDIEAILALSDAPAAPNTINKGLTRIAALFKWAVEYGYTALNPASGMTIKNPKRASEERQAFTEDDLKKLFHSPKFLEGQLALPYMRWTPLIALYSGARLNEIAQLHLSDFVEADGIPVISINDQGEGKRLKTKAGRRLIPVHAELIRLGLLQYVEDLRGKGETRLFPELIERRDGYGQTVSNWFQRYRVRCGITEDGKVFHSFRHTVIDRLKQAGIAKEKIAALVGHEDDSVTFGRYGKDFAPSIMALVVSAIDFTGISAEITPLHIGAS